MAKEFAARGFKNAKIVGVIDVITQSAIAIRDAVRINERSRIHAAERKWMRGKFNGEVGGGKNCQRCECVYVGVMNSDWQTVVSLLLVAAAAIGLLWGRFRKRKKHFHRDSPCGCVSEPSNPQQSIIFRARKGERPQIIVKNKPG